MDISLQDINIKDTYWSGEDNIIHDFYIPCLSNAINYDRAVGFFSSSILKYISDGLYNFIKNDGKIRLVCSPKLSSQDKEKIDRGYKLKDIITQSLDQELKKILEEKDQANVKNLCWLIKNDRLDIKICLRNVSNINSYTLDNIIFHEKFGVFKDDDNNIISFLGSVNESLYGWLFNEESFEVSYSWEPALKNRVKNKINRFEKLWEGTANNVTTYEFPDALKNKLIENSPLEPVDVVLSPKYKIKNSRHMIKDNSFIFKPRQCQIDAYNKFKENEGVCIFQMATGSGKTMAALHSFRETDDWRFLLIVVPTKELVTQWEEDVKKFFPESYIIKCLSDNPKWKTNLLDLVQAKIPFMTIVISTYDSAKDDFAMDKWEEINRNIFGVIFDEAHNLGGNQTQRLMQLNPKYKLGLSATPQRNFDEEGTLKIVNFFNNNSYNFSIREAIKENYLVEYYYYVYPVLLTDCEWQKYKKISKQISKFRYMNNNEEKDEDNILQRKYRERAKIIKTAKNKLDVFTDIMVDIPEENRLLIYAESKKHLNGYAEVLTRLKRDYFIYTGDKDSKIERPTILEEFKLGTRKILLAINCLDEGIDIPVCDSAIFISSSTSKRQFIQRRGRVLRKSIGKHRAYVYDYIVIPEVDINNSDEIKLAKQVVKKEYERINIIADDAINGIDTKQKIDKFLDLYDLNLYRY